MHKSDHFPGLVYVRMYFLLSKCSLAVPHCTRLLSRVRAMLVMVPPIVVDRTKLGLKIPLQLQGRAEPHIYVKSATVITPGLHSCPQLTSLLLLGNARFTTATAVCRCILQHFCCVKSLLQAQQRRREVKTVIAAYHCIFSPQPDILCFSLYHTAMPRSIG